ncbi:uncharacterized protein LOC115620382 [Scaptodrosophila lebanonensis]|uniref:Uncharacterized protein LOC115620382 n=1 Tax=Drosophila lebanonensis TaxID=7225 RepID=A0A6J2T2I9_DROLE|nr:uncharacterized protein LOC115620382 [Scaptodrosophila lebanonensis]
MAFPFRGVNCALQLIITILEFIALDFLCFEVIYTHCVLGGEYGASVFLQLYLLPAIFFQSLILALFRVCCGTVGLDPIAVIFNLSSGIICTITSIMLLIAMIGHCGNDKAYRFYTTGICGLIAGVLHLINAIVCNIYMPRGEEYHLKPSKTSRYHKTRAAALGIV